MTTATILVPIRIREANFECYLDNLTYCFSSIKLQDHEGGAIVIDYGSASSYAHKIKSLAGKFNIQYVRGEGGIWSRSRSLNIGIRCAKSTHVLFVDADCILPTDYISSHIKELSNNKVFTYSPVHDTSKNVIKSSKIVDVKKYSTGIRPKGNSHMGVSTKWLINNGGFNKDYVGWGGEDDELWLRLTVAKLNPVKVEKYPYHLWHPPYGTLMANIGKGKLHRRNVITNRARLHKLYIKHKKE